MTPQFDPTLLTRCVPIMKNRRNDGLT